MSTCQSIVRRALRSIGAIAGGKQPTGADAQDGMERLQSVILGLPGLIHNGRWCDYATTTAATAREGQRITVTTPGSVALPLIITNCGPSRPPHDLAKVQILGADASNAGIWLYSASKGAWGRADELALGDEAPFGEEDDEGLAAQLAVNISDEFGETATVGARTLALAQASVRSMRARLKRFDTHEHRRSDPAWCDY